MGEERWGKIDEKISEDRRRGTAGMALYMKRFGKKAPDSIPSFKEITKLKIQKKVAAKERKAVRRTTAALSETEDQKQNNSDTPQVKTPQDEHTTL